MTDLIKTFHSRALRQVLQTLPAGTLGLALFGFCAPTPAAFAQQTLSGAQNPQTPAPQAGAPIIRSIEVRGNKVLNRESIIGPTGLMVGQPITQQALNVATRNLVATGNFGVHFPDNPEKAVLVEANIDPAKNEAAVIITVDENDVVKDFTITGTGPLTAKEIEGLLQTKKERILNLNILNQDVRRIQEHYTSKGYQALINAEGFGITNGILEIPITVGKVNKINLVGLNKTRSRVVLREMQGVREGDYYSSAKLQRAFTNVFNTGLFEDIQPAILTPAPGLVDITLNLQERRSGTVSASVGYSSRNHLVGRLEVAENNLFGLGQQASAMWETGGLANRNSFEVSFTEPWLDKRHTSLSVSLYDRVVYRFGTSIGSAVGQPVAGNSGDYYETRTGGSITVSRPFSETLRGFVGFRYENVKVPSISLNVQDAAILQNGPLAIVTLKGVNNTRDYDQDPAIGGFDSLSADVGQADLSPVTIAGQPSQGVFGQLNFTKLTLDARRYFSKRGRRVSPKDRRHVLAARLMVGASAGRLPFSEQFFVGGAEALRGFNEDRFWGSNMVLGSVEYRAPVASALTGVVFADVGDAWGGSYRNVQFNGFGQHNSFSPNVGIGIGLRVVTPIGPIRIDQGFSREGGRTHFSIGHVF